MTLPQSDLTTSTSGTAMPDFTPAAVAYYINAGGDTGLTVALNENAWKRWSLQPRVLRNVSVIDTTIELCGISMSSPLIVAPMSGLSSVHSGAEAECAAGAAAAGVTLCLTSGSAADVEAVGRSGGRFLQQLYLWPQRERIRPFLERAAAAGAAGFVLTVDSPPQAARYGFRGRSDGLEPVHSPHFPEGAPPAGSPADLTYDDISWLREAGGLPVLVKGVLHPDDAAAAVLAGAAGVVVSNHGGRQSDGCVTTAEVLPEIAAAVAGRVPVLVDGGIRSGEDIVRALALGADAVLIGRPVAWALARGGAAAVADLLTGFQAAMRAQLALCGVTCVRDVPRDLVRWRHWG